MWFGGGLGGFGASMDQLICITMVCWYLSNVITKSSKMEESLPFTFLNSDEFVFYQCFYVLMSEHGEYLLKVYSVVFF